MEDAGILKKGPWGFYKTVKEGFVSVYENLENPPTDAEKAAAEAAKAEATAQAMEGVPTPTMLPPGVSVGIQNLNESSGVTDAVKAADKAKEGAKELAADAQKDLIKAGEDVKDKVEKNSSTFVGGSVNSILNADLENGKERYRVNEDWNAIVAKFTQDRDTLLADISKFEYGNAKQNGLATMSVFKDIFNLIIDIISLMDSSSHPNALDAAGEAFGQMFFLIASKIDKKDEKHYTDYALAILYFWFSISVAYFVSENWAYNLFYNHAKHNIDDTPHEILENCKNSESYFRKPIFYFFYHLFLPVIIFDYSVAYLREYTVPLANSFVGFMGILRILLFFAVFLTCQYFTALTQNGIYEGIVFFMGFVGIPLLIYRWDFSYGTFNFIPYIIMFFLLYSQLFAFFKISKIMVFIYLLFLSFFYIVRNENMSLATVYWNLQMTKEMNYYYNTIYDDYIVGTDPEHKKPIYNVSKFIFNNWFIMSIILIFIMFWFVLLKDQTTLANTILPFVVSLIVMLCWLLFMKLKNYLVKEVNGTTVYENETWMSLIMPQTVPKVLVELDDKIQTPTNYAEVLMKGIREFISSIVGET